MRIVGYTHCHEAEYRPYPPGNGFHIICNLSATTSAQHWLLGSFESDVNWVDDPMHRQHPWRAAQAARSCAGSRHQAG